AARTGPGFRARAPGWAASAQPPLAGEVQRGCRAPWVEGAVAPHRLARRHRLDVDAARPQPFERAGVGGHAAVGARADNEPFRKLSEDVGEVLEHEPITARPPRRGAT